MLAVLNDAIRHGVYLVYTNAGLIIRGPRSADAAARALAAHKKQIDTWLRLGRVVLDWRDRPALRHAGGCLLCCDIRDDEGRHIPNCHGCGPAWNRRRPDPCALCGHTAHFTDDGRPVHKACVEAEVWRRLVALRDRRAAA